MTNEKKPRSAGVRREDRLAAGLDSSGIAKAVKEIDSTHRVYGLTWLHDAWLRSEDEVKVHVAKKWEDRLPDGSVEVRPPTDATGGKWQVRVLRWNVLSEWKTEEKAREDEVAWKNDPQVEATEVVARNSRREHELKQIGLLKIK